MKTQLFIENFEIELNEGVQFLLNKEFEHLSNPTNIINDWSKSVQIPFTEKNNKTFGYIYNPNRVIVSDGTETSYTKMGIYFDPTKKLDFRLVYNNFVLMEGYAKMLDIKMANYTGTYNITLNGQLGKIFQELKKITFDTTTEDTKYLINGSKYVNSVVDKDLIYLLWNNEPDLTNLDLTETTDANYRVQDYIGFIPNNSYDDNFDYKTFQKEGSEQSKKFTQELDDRTNIIYGKTYEYLTGIAADTVIGEGLLPREIGEYRSYMQIPYIYFNKLFQIFNKKTEEITGYEVEMDSDWFNNSNPYWSKMVYILKKFDQKEVFDSYIGETNQINTSTFTLNNGDGILQQPDTYIPASFTPNYTTFTNEAIEKVRQDYIEGKVDSVIINEQYVPLRLTLTNPFNKYNVEVGTETDNIIFNNTTHFYVVFRVLNENGEPVGYSKNIIVSEDFNEETITDNTWNIIRVGDIPNQGGRVWSIDINVKLTLFIDRSTAGDNFTIDISAYFNNLIVYYFCLNEVDTYLNNIIAPQTISVKLLDGVEFNISTNNTYKRSGANFNLNDIWNNEFNIFDEVVNYCKQYRIGVFCDNINKKLIYKPLSSYFSNYSILDWTDKLDMSKECHIQPITFENKYVLFNYEKYATELNNEYNKNFGRNFGEYRLTTQYEFNTEEKSLFKYSKVTIPSTDMCLSWGNLYDNFSVIYTLPQEITAYNKDKDKKNVDVFGSMLFYKGLSKFDTTSPMRPVFITDDTKLQSLNQVFFYTQKGQEDKYIRSEYYPVLDIVDGNNLCTFAIPSANYTYVKGSYDNKNGIYKNFWENYLNERYNIQNKVVTCYLYLTPYDIANFQYNNFVKIQNQLYMVNKIYDYNIETPEPTKVDLITITDIKGYTE